MPKAISPKPQNAGHNEEVDVALAALAEKEGNSAAEQEALEKASTARPWRHRSLKQAGHNIGKSWPDQKEKNF
jgi:hypothetical protein